MLKMPIGYATSASTTAHLDRFTTRCRVSATKIRARPQHMSQYVVVREKDAGTKRHATDKRDTVFLCRAALRNGYEYDDDDDAVLSFDRSVRMVARPLLFANLGGADAGYTGGAYDVQWIPKTSMRNAATVTLEVVVDDDDAHGSSGVDGDQRRRKLARDRKKQVADWLRDFDYRQVLQETLQHHFLVCRHALVQLPMPSGFGAAAGGDNAARAVLEFKVMSVYPDDDAFVRITPNTRVILSAASPDDEDAHIDQATALTETVSSSAAANPKIGGLEKEQTALREMILLPVETADLGERCGIEFPKGLLLCGPPGVGKTLLVRTVVHECSAQIPLQLTIINGAEIMTSGVGDAENTLRKIFMEASDHARRTSGASVIFIDELDALCPKRESSGSATAHSRIVAQLLTLLDGADKQARDHVVIVGATNLPNSIDAALRRPGRFDRELFIAPPDTAARKKIFEMNVQDMPICVHGSSSQQEKRSDFLDTLASKSIGYVGADIAALCREALAVATTRTFVTMTNDQELENWWTEWKRHSKSLYNANFSTVVAGNAWKANPIAIPLWFFAKQHEQQQEQQDNSGRDRRNASDSANYFSFLLHNGERNQSQPAPNDEDRECEPQHVIAHDAASGRDRFEVTMGDFEQAMQVVVASSLRGASGFSKDFEKLGWDSIGGQDHTKLALQQALEWPIKFPQTFARLGVKVRKDLMNLLATMWSEF